MQAGTKNNLNSSEISGIWDSYIQNSLGQCTLDYFLSKVNDTDIHFLLEYVRNTYEQRNIRLKEVFNQEDLPVPQGFTKDDVNFNAPSPFTDGFYLWYLNSFIYFEMNTNTFILDSISNPALRHYFTKCIEETIDFYNRDVDLLTSRGIFVDAPRVEVPKEVSFIKDESFLGNWFLDPRPLLANEVATIYAMNLYNEVNRFIYEGFGRVALSKDVRDFMFKGKEISTKHIEELSEKLKKEDIHISSLSDSLINQSTMSPFSDKLMMFSSLVLTELLLINSTVGIIGSFGKNLQAIFAKHAAENDKYAFDGLSIMIENEWLEQPPQVVKSENLVRI